MHVISESPLIQLALGDCLAEMRALPSGSFAAVVTDPPAAVRFMGRSWDGDRGGRSAWVAWLAERLREAYRLTRPGGWALVWALPRTSHWTALAVEDAGWTIRDRVTALFGQGFPKSKACLKPGMEDWWLAYKPDQIQVPLQIDACRIEAGDDYQDLDVTQGSEDRIYGTGKGLRSTPTKFKPASGRWPANVVLVHSPSCRLVGTRRVKGDPRTGGDGTRPGGFVAIGTASGNGRPAGRLYGDADGTEEVSAWECSEDCPVARLDRQSGTLKRRGNKTAKDYGTNYLNTSYCFGGRERGWSGDSGGASRFFATFSGEPNPPGLSLGGDLFVYAAKASRRDRGPDNKHPTVKNSHLMRWLCRLVTPPGEPILDPFMGSGSTGVAAAREGFGFLGIDDDSEPGAYDTAVRRIAEACTQTNTKKNPKV